jgi:NCAIR mutase (PurE)-related protein
MPFEALDGVAAVDHHRELRSAIPEVVLGESKTAEHIAKIMASLAAGGSGALATRVDSDKAAVVQKELPEARYDSVSRVLVIEPPQRKEPVGHGEIFVVSAGTSDLPVAEEAAQTVEFLGHRVRRINDVGVAGLHRVVSVTEELRSAAVVVAVAGMEGALPGVIAGLIPAPIIAVPTSIGYGVGVGGFVAMMSMLASCSPGVSVVNIDNGFGAAVAATRINRTGKHKS